MSATHIHPLATPFLEQSSFTKCIHNLGFLYTTVLSLNIISLFVQSQSGGKDAANTSVISYLIAVMAQTDSKPEEKGQASGQSQQPEPQRSLYESSSQFRHWRFSPEQLTSIRRTLNEAAVGAIRDAFEKDEVYDFDT